MSLKDRRAAMSAVLLACVAAVVGACTVTIPNVLNGSGPVRTETRSVGAFTRLELRNGIRLELSIGTPALVEVTAQENLLPIVTSAVAGDRLTVAATQNYNSVNGIVVRVVVPSIVELAGVAGAYMNGGGIAEQNLTLRLESGAVANLTGTVDNLTLTASDGALLTLGGLVARVATINVSNGVTGTMAASESVSGTASNGVLLSITGGATVNVATSAGAIVNSQ